MKTRYHKSVDFTHSVVVCCQVPSDVFRSRDLWHEDTRNFCGAGGCRNSSVSDGSCPLPLASPPATHGYPCINGIWSFMS